MIINKLKEKIKSSSFLRSVVTVASGTVIAQAISVLVSPIITRMYTPEDMGVLASYTAIVSILGVVSAGCYDQAIVLPKTDRESKAVSIAGLVFSLVFSLIITLFTLLFNKPLVILLKLKGDASSWLHFLGLFVFLTGLELVLSRVAIRNRHFRVIASTQITQQISNNGIKIAWGFFNPGCLALFVSTLFSTISRVVRLGIGEFRFLHSKDDRPSKYEIKYAFNRYKNFPLISSWSGLLNTASVQLPVVLFTSLFSPTIAGFYSLSHRILSLPIFLIGKSVGDVFLERASKTNDNDEELGKITLEIYKKLLLISSFILSFVIFYGDILFTFVFGPQWAESGKYAQWISIWIIIQIVYSPLSSLYIIKEKQSENFLFQLILFLSRLSIAVLPLFTQDIFTIIKIYSIISLLVYFFGSFRLLTIVKLKVKTIFLATIKPISLLVILHVVINILLHLLLKL